MLCHSLMQQYLFSAPRQLGPMGCTQCCNMQGAGDEPHHSPTLGLWDYCHRSQGSLVAAGGWQLCLHTGGLTSWAGEWLLGDLSWVKNSLQNPHTSLWAYKTQLHLSCSSFTGDS